MKQNLLKFSNSQAGQDMFALAATDYKQKGYFVDLGCRHPITHNNSFLLESQYFWNGVLVDFDIIYTDLCKQVRRSKVFCEDLTAKSVNDILIEANSPQVIDYLSLDLDNGAALTALKSIDFNKFKFRCITFEHDSYIDGDKIKSESRKIFEKNSYYLICKDVKFEGKEFEDWYVHESELEHSNNISNILNWDKYEYQDIIAAL